MICPCCGGDAERCILTPVGCVPREPDAPPDDAHEYAVWRAACLLLEHQPDLLSDAGRTYARTPSPDGMPF